MTSVVIPAHNEASVIRRCLDSVFDGYTPENQLHVYVVCNGCTDNTAAVAAGSGHPNVTVIEIAGASKTAALNAGDAAAGLDFPRIYIDADVVIGPTSVAQLGSLLSAGGVQLSAPRLRVDLSGRPWVIRRYYAAFMRSAWVQEDMIGSGVYGVSEEGWRRISPFPSILNDDKWVFDNFLRSERLSAPGWFTIQAPRTIAALVRAKARVACGERELVALREIGVLPERVFRPERGGLRRQASIWRAMPLSMLVWSSVRGAARLSDRRARSRGTDKAWRTDTTTRTAELE